ncbi:DUF4129 domain-containing protein [Microbacteriaceae bacterium 4G12]
MRARERSFAAAVVLGALILLAVLGSAVRGPWILERRTEEVPFRGARTPTLTPAPSPEEGRPPLDGVEDLPRLDLSWLPGVLIVLLAAVVALVLWRLWLRYRRAGAPAEESARSAGVTAGADAVPELPVLLRGVEAARLSLGSVADPGDAVIAAWLSLEDAAAESGVRRHPAQTPTEFTLAILGSTRADADATRELLGLYHLARFSTHPVTADHVERASRCLGAIAESGVAARPAGASGAGGSGA